MRRMVEIDLAQQLNYDEKYISMLKLPSLEAEEEKRAEMELTQPEVPGEKPSTFESIIKESWDWTNQRKEEDLSIEEFVNLKEFRGFNYKEFIKAILSQVKADQFIDLKAINEQQLIEGLLSETEIKELRNILYEGFKKNKPLVVIEKEVAQKIQFKDRLNEGKIVLAAEKRPSAVTRTETVRLTNEGLINMYKKNDIEEVSWLSSISDRTCPRCLELDGRVFKINEAPIPAKDTHPNCRCVLLSVKS